MGAADQSAHTFAAPPLMNLSQKPWKGKAKLIYWNNCWLLKADERFTFCFSKFYGYPNYILIILNSAAKPAKRDSQQQLNQLRFHKLT